MSLTIKHLNADTSFLLTFRPNEPCLPTAECARSSFTILLDPWLTGDSKIWHPRFSLSRQKVTPCISSLSALQEPDVIIISQDKSDHCHEATLKTLPPSGGKTLILAEPSSARMIRRWGYFEASRVATLPKWNARRPSTIYRIPIPPLSPVGTAGEVTVAFLAQKPDLSGLHSAVGITYRPPTYSPVPISPTTERQNHLLTPPASPNSIYSTTTSNRALSCIYSPHGCSYKTIMPYAYSHLLSSGALPLTALLHCFNRVSNPWYLGGNICSGFPGGVEIAQDLLARCWISAHDGERVMSGFATSKMQTKMWHKDEVEEVVSPRSDRFPDRRIGTNVIVLGVGEERTVWPDL